MNNRLIKSNDAGGGACTNTVDLYNPFPDGGGVALYQLNGDATDVSGNYNGTATNVTYGAGQFGQAGVFNGSSSYINIPITTANTISFWVYLNNFSTTQAIAGSNSDTSKYLYIDTNGGVLVNTQTYITPSTSIQSATWEHIVFTESAGTVSMYLNGQFVGSVLSNLNGFNLLGARTVGTPQYLDGKLDQVRIFSRALRPYEVEALYTEEYCTPTIVPSEHFNTVLFTPTTSTSPLPVTGVGFQPDFVWAKYRNGIQNHYLFDSVRGGYLLRSNTTDAELTGTVYMDSFDPDGFTTTNNLFNRTETDSVVSWNFKAGGAAVTNTDGTITSQVSANTEAGFSIVSYTGNGVSGTTVGHGLNTAPSIVITKGRSFSDVWLITGTAIGDNDTNYLLFSTAAMGSSATVGSSNPTTLDIGTSTASNTSGQTFISYCFAEVEGFSSFGSYVGNGSTSGPTVVTGFEPAFVMVKNASSGDNWHRWYMFDNKRDTVNPNTLNLAANTSDAEPVSGDAFVNFLENGFQVQTGASPLSVNQSGDTFIYMAFAADPTTVEPTLEDSFNTLLYTGTGASRSITGVGFQPDWTWIKKRSSATLSNHMLFDSVRGADKVIITNLTQAEYNGGGTGYLPSFDSDGFSLTGNTFVNGSGDTYVAWNWKGAEIPAINSNGSIPSVVSANPAAGFSIVSYTGSTGTVGHGFGVIPKVIIQKRTDSAQDWYVYFPPGVIDGNYNYMVLNSTAAVGTTGATPPTTTTFNPVAASGNYIAYCFAEVAGFSKFGSYVGNGSTSGPTIDCGFEPAFVMVKAATRAGSWFMSDNKRQTSGVSTTYLLADSSDAETPYTWIEYLPNGFQLKNTGGGVNLSGDTYIYMAFANQF